MRRAASQATLLVRSRLADSGATSSCRAFSSEPVTAALFPGDGIGPEIADAVRNIFTAQGVPIQWEEQYIGKTADPRTNSMVTRENLDSVLVRFALSTSFFIKSTKHLSFLGTCNDQVSNSSESPGGKYDSLLHPHFFCNRLPLWTVYFLREDATVHWSILGRITCEANEFELLIVYSTLDARWPRIRFQ